MGHTVEQKCCDSSTFWLYLLVIIGLLLFSGLMSGLTLGLMSLGMVDLEVIKKSGKPEDRKHAEKIVPVVRRQHLLLVTLLVGNAMAMEALPLFLDSLVDTWMAIVLSVTLLLMFGEILPQAVCSRYGLAVGAAMAPIVRLLLIIMFPIAWPVSKLLDKLLGADRHNGLFGRAELKTLVDMHSNEAGNGGDLSSHETRIIAGALELADKTARHAMTPIPAIVSVEMNSKLDDAAMMSILSSGFSRIPVFTGKPENIIGLIVVKNLLNVTIEARSKLPVIDVPIRKIPSIPENMPLYEVLHQFQQGRSHMAAVIRSPNTASVFGEDHDESCIDVNMDRDVGVGVDVDVDSRMKLEKVDRLNDLDSKGKESDHALDCKNVEEGKIENSVTSNVVDDSNHDHESSVNDNTNAHACQDLADHDEDSKRGYYRLVSWTEEEFKGNIIGIITREDVLDELLKEEVPPDSVSNDCTIEAVDQEFTKVSMRELEASLHPNTGYDDDHSPSPRFRQSVGSAADDPHCNTPSSGSLHHQNLAQTSPFPSPPPPSPLPHRSFPSISTRGDYHAEACVLAARSLSLKLKARSGSGSPAKIAGTPERKSTSGTAFRSKSLRRQRSIVTLESSDSPTSPRYSFSGADSKSVVDPWPSDPKENSNPVTEPPSQAPKSSSAPSSPLPPSPAKLRKSGVGSQSMNGRTPYVPRSRMSGIIPFRTFISRAFMHGGQESPIAMTRQRAFQNDAE